LAGRSCCPLRGSLPPPPPSPSRISVLGWAHMCLSFAHLQRALGNGDPSARVLLLPASTVVLGCPARMLCVRVGFSHEEFLAHLRPPRTPSPMPPTCAPRRSSPLDALNSTLNSTRHQGERRNAPIGLIGPIALALPSDKILGSPCSPTYTAHKRAMRQIFNLHALPIMPGHPHCSSCAVLRTRARGVRHWRSGCCDRRSMHFPLARDLGSLTPSLMKSTTVGFT
jgi:hypothetical protein